MIEMVSIAKMIRKHPINYKKEIKCSRILKNVDIILVARKYNNCFQREYYQRVKTMEAFNDHFRGYKSKNLLFPKHSDEGYQLIDILIKFYKFFNQFTMQLATKVTNS